MQESQVSTHPAAHWVVVDDGERPRLEMRWAPPVPAPMTAPAPAAASTAQPVVVTHAA